MIFVHHRGPKTNPEIAPQVRQDPVRAPSGEPVSGPASALGMSRATIYRKVAQYEIAPHAIDEWGASCRTRRHPQ